MPIAKDDLSTNAKGGSELMKEALLAKLGESALEEFQIFVSRVQEELDETKIRIFWAHDLPNDPASEVLKDEGWKKFHKLVFVSNWQMQAYINHYRLPWSRCIVLQNAIEPIPYNSNKINGSEKIKLIYTPTPHRGLEILLPVFDKLCEKYNNLELDVYSSFKLYGWEERDKQFEALFKYCEEHPKINYHGAVSNDEVRKALQESHIFAYPSIWPETSCRCLLEAMSAGNICVHSNYAALPETSANWTYMYHLHEDKNEHAKILYTILTSAIDDIKLNPAEVMNRLMTQKSYVDIFYCWENRALQWSALLNMLLASVTDRGFERPMFTYSVN